jgi:hypothetical protein
VANALAVNRARTSTTNFFLDKELNGLAFWDQTRLAVLLIVADPQTGKRQ